MAQYYKGKFQPKNPAKYRGNPTNIVYRSGWELRVCKWLDENPSILEWASEEVQIPYFSPIDGIWHRYFPDYLVKMRDRDGKVSVRMLEVKPHKQTKPPTVRKNGSKITQKYINEVRTWGVNDAKWKAAEEYCKDRGWTFHLITEKELNL
jgi:hypothetical protein